ncbi:hypothetical protein BH10PAT1_BH10PAT1_6470 [soil metagenome]
MEKNHELEITLNTPQIILTETVDGLLNLGIKSFTVKLLPKSNEENKERNILPIIINKPIDLV